MQAEVVLVAVKRLPCTENRCFRVRTGANVAAECNAWKLNGNPQLFCYIYHG